MSPARHQWLAAGACLLLMNAMVPFINRVTQPRVFGTTGQKVRVTT